MDFAATVSKVAREAARVAAEVRAQEAEWAAAAVEEDEEELDSEGEVGPL